MTGVALVLNRYRSDVQAHRDVVLARVALGASWREAVARRAALARRTPRCCRRSRGC